MRASILFVVALLFSSAALRGDAWIIPGVANLTIGPAHYISDLQITNRGTDTFTASFEFIPRAAENAPPLTNRDIAAGATLVIPDALNALWGLVERVGAIRVTAPSPLIITSRKHINDPQSNQGASLPIIAEGDLLQPGDKGHALWLSSSADPGTGFRSRVGLALVTPDAAGTVVFFDAAGTEAGRQTFSGGIQFLEVPLDALNANDLPVARAEVRVDAGWVAAYGELIDNITGDSAVQQASVANSSLTDMFVEGVYHTLTPTGAVLRTDLRLWNAATRATAVALTFQGKRAVVNVPAGGMIELSDVLASQFQVTDSAMGAVELVGLVSVLARTIAAYPDGSPGGFSGFEDPADATVLPGPGSLTVIPALSDTTDQPGSQSWIGAIGGPDGGAATLSLKNLAGEVVATTDLFGVNAKEWRSNSLAAIFPGVDIPEGVTLEISPVSGTLDVFAVVLDNATGDPDFRVSQTAAPAACSPPSIDLLTASATYLAAAGNVTVSWMTSLAETVEIQPGHAGLSFSGSTQVPVSATTTLTLVATNSCGATGQNIRIAVGSPAVQSVVNPASSGASGSSSGMPGELIALTIANVSDPADVTSVIFTASDGRQVGMPVSGSNDAGDILLTVPWFADQKDPRGYRTGSFRVSAVVNGQTSTAATFTILPLQYASDPVKGFSAFLDQAFGAFRDQLTAEQGMPDSTATVPIRMTMLAQYEALLRKLVTDLTASPTAKLPVDVAIAGNPPPATVTADRTTLGTLLAYNNNLVNAAIAITGGPSMLKAKVQPRDAGTCLAQKAPLVFFCKRLAEAGFFFYPLTSRFGELFDWDFFAAASEAAEWALGAAVFAILNNANLVAQVTCRSFPVELPAQGGFYLTTYHIPTRHTLKLQPRTRVTQGDPVSIFARLKADEPAEKAIEFVESQFTSWAKKYVPGPEPLQALRLNAAQKLFTAVDKFLRQQLAEAIKKYGPPTPTKDYQVGTCDLTTVYAKRNGPQENYRIGHPIQRGDQNPFGVDDYFYIGRRRAPETICIFPDASHFLFESEIKQGILLPIEGGRCPKSFSVPIGVRSEDPSVRVAPVNQAVVAIRTPLYEAPIEVDLLPKTVTVMDWTSFDGIDGTSNFAALQPNLDVIDGNSYTPDPTTDGLSDITVQVIQTQANQWQVSLSGTGYADQNSGHRGEGNLTLQIFNPPTLPDSTTTEIVIDATSGGTCGISWGYSIFDTNDMRLAEASVFHLQAPQKFHVDAIGGLTGQLVLGITTASAGPGIEYPCSMTATIQLLEQ